MQTAARSQPEPPSAASSGASGDDVVVLAADQDSRVERIARGGRQLLRKSYWSRGLPSWRTLWRRSRAEREFRNLRALADGGVPAVPALEWRERRVGGRVRSCEIVTAFVDAVNLRSALAAGLSPAARRAHARALGGLLRRLHAQGFCSSTLSLRNVLLRPDGGLLLCDQPYAARLWGPVGAWARGLDLYDTFFSLSRRGDWSRSERLRGLCAYVGDDREQARRLWRRMSRRGRLWFRLARQLSRLAVFHVPPRARAASADPTP